MAFFCLKAGMPSRFLFFRRCRLACAFLLVAAPGLVCAEKWEELDGCRFVPNESNDGDSFHVKHKGKEFIFRLYFVDAPETSELIPSRVTEQAEAFGVSRERVLEAGKKAAEFTANQLRKSFTVRTKWQDAEGMSRLARNYALVETADGKDLGELLAGAGYVRSFGASAAPSGRSKPALRSRYDRLTERAARSKLGAWGTESSGAAIVIEDVGDIEEEEEPVQKTAESAASTESEPGMIPGMPSMDALSETIRMESEPVTETP